MTMEELRTELHRLRMLIDENGLRGGNVQRQSQPPLPSYPMYFMRYFLSPDGKVYRCGVCGALVPHATREQHADWHKELRREE